MLLFHALNGCGTSVKSAAVVIFLACSFEAQASVMGLNDRPQSYGVKHDVLSVLHLPQHHGLPSCHCSLRTSNNTQQNRKEVFLIFLFFFRFGFYKGPLKR